MSSIKHDQARQHLRDQAHFLYSDSVPIPRTEFLRTFWDTLARFTHHQKHNDLIQCAVLDHLDLIPRTYAILCVLYGAFTYEPTKYQLLSSFIDLLDKDLVEEELKVSEYARQQKPDTMYFSGIAEIVLNIHNVYGKIEWKSEDLPPSPYLGFVFLALNHPDVFDIRSSLDAIGNALHESHLSMLGVYQKVNAR